MAANTTGKYTALIPITYLRSSMAGTLAMCEMQFFSEYILGWTGPSNMKADKGTMVHKVMEILAHFKLASQNNEQSIIDDIVGEYTVDIDNLPLDEIIEKVYDYYKKLFNHHDWQPKDFREIKRWVYKTLESAHGIYNPLTQTILQPERSFEISLKNDWAQYNYDGLKGTLKLKGTIDLITQPDEDTLEIVDYKTGKRINWATGEEKTYNYLQQDFQLRFYHLAASILYPHIKNFLITIYFINDGGPFTVGFGREDIPETLNNVREMYERIRDMKIPKLTRSWKCSKLCYQCKTSFKDCGIPNTQPHGNENFPLIDKLPCKCDSLNYLLQFRNIEAVIKNMQKPGHSISHYSAPGEV